MKLNRTPNPLDRIARNGENENWDIIEGEVRAIGDRVDNFVDEVSEDAYNKLVEDARLDWREMVDEYSDLPNDPKKGTTVGVKEQGIIYRYNGSSWDRLFEINLNPIAEVDSRLSSQLADTVEYADSGLGLLYTRKHEKRPIVSFITDDGALTDYTLLKPVIENKKVPMGLAIVTSWMDTSNFMSTEQIKEMESIGCEILSHSHTHRQFSLLTKEEQIEEFATSKRILRSKGFNPRLFVYPYNSSDNNSRISLPQYYEGGFAKYVYANGAMPGLNTPRFRNREIGRNALGSYFDATSEGFPQDTTTLEYYKAVVDHAEQIGNWLVFVLHSNAMDSQQVQYFSDIVDYVRGKGIDIVSPSEGLEIYGNIVEIIGKKGEIIIGADGDYVGENLSSTTSELNKYTASTKPSAFPANSASTFFVNTGGAQGFPNDTAGVVTTYRVGDQFGYAKQEYRPYLGVGLWMRTGRNDDSWGGWRKVDEILYEVEKNLNKYTASTKPSAFTANTITTFPVNTEGAQGFPNDAAGIVTTYRVGNQLGYSKQEFRAYSSTGIWMRTAHNDDSWGDWVDMTPGSVVRNTKNSFSADSPITDFPLNNITTFRFDSVGSEGFPTHAGIVTTYRVDNVNWSRQECRQYKGNGIWSRYWDTDGWSPWVKVSVV